MSPVARYLDALRAELRTTGAPRRRFLAECAEHLRESADALGEAAAVERFGDPAEVALAFDAEVAATRGARATLVSGMALVLAAAVVLAFAHGAGAGASAPRGLGITFFLAAQAATAVAALAGLQALRWRRATAPGGALALLARRDAIALGAGALTLLSTAWVVEGTARGAALAAALTACGVAAALALRAGRLATTLPGAAQPVESPFDDLAALSAPLPGVPAAVQRLGAALDPLRAPVRCCAAVALVAAAAAFARDHGEGASTGQAAVTAAVEATAVVACFVLLGRPLGLRAG